MNTYTVTYTEPDYPFTLYFHCHAENADHAKEQCEDAYPSCTVQSTKEGIK